MNQIQSFSKQFLYIFVFGIIFLCQFLVPFQSIAIENLELTPGVSEASKTFSDRFCKFIESGLTPEKAGESSAREIAKNLFFSPVSNEIITVSKELLASSLSNNIFERCGEDLEISQQELKIDLTKLANKIPTKSSRSFPVIQQRSSFSQNSVTH